jgi:hypothetical protein
VTITGSSFTGATQIQVGASVLTPGAGFLVVTDSTITFTAPTATALGPVSVVVTNPSGPSLPGGFTFVECVPAKLSTSAVTLTGSPFTWNYGAGANDTAVIIAALDSTTFDFGTPYQILLNFNIIGYGTCDAAGIGSFGAQIPPGFSGVTFYSQVAGVDEITNLFTVSNITATFILF